MNYADVNGDGEVTPGEIIEENNYYPFGLKHQGYNELAGDVHKYKFLNREHQPELGLNTIATDYRHYDAALGRFNNMDALSELAPNQTPYRYGFNNPVYWSDPTGLFETEQHASNWMNRWGVNGQTYSLDGIWYVYNEGVNYYMDGDLLRFYYSVSNGDGDLNELVIGFSNSGRPVGGAGGSNSGSSGNPSGNGPSGPSGPGPGGPSNGAGPGGVSGGTGTGTTSNQSIEFISSVGTATSIVEQGAQRGERLYNRQSAHNSNAAQKAVQSAKVAKWMGRAGTAANIVTLGTEFINTVNNPNATGADYAKIGAKVGVLFIETAANSVLPGSGIVIGILLNYAIDEYGDDIYNSVVDGYNTLVL